MSRPVSSSSGCRQDERGEYVYRRGALGQAKGWVKSPLGAVLALAEFCGPTAPPVPWVQLAACAEEQAVPNTYSLIWTFLSENESKAAPELGRGQGAGAPPLQPGRVDTPRPAGDPAVVSRA